MSEVQTLARGLRVLDMLAASPEPIGVTQLAKEMRFSESQIYRKLKSITDLHTKIEWSRDFVYKNKNIAYQITPGEHILETKFLNYILLIWILQHSWSFCHGYQGA